MKFRKKPVIVEAFQLPPLGVEASEELIAFLHGGDVESAHDGCVLIQTLEGTMEGRPGDWIVRGIHGEFYPVKPEIFAETYAPAVDFPRSFNIARIDDFEAHDADAPFLRLTISGETIEEFDFRLPDGVENLIARLLGLSK